MLYMVLFEDNPARAAMRAKHADEHFAFLERNAVAIKAAGPFKENGSPAGALWRVDAADEAAVKALYEADPFWTAGLRKSVRVLEWTHVFQEGKRI